MNRFMTLTLAAAVLALAASAHAGVIFSAAGPITATSEAVDSGAGNVNNAALGLDRTLIVTFDVEITDNDTQSSNDPTADAWAAVGFGFDDDSGSSNGGDVLGFTSGSPGDQSEFALLIRSITGSTGTHTAWEDGDNTGGSFGSDLGGTPGDPNDGIDGKVRVTVNLSAAGIAAGESATVKYEVDNDADGTFDDTVTKNVDWEDTNNFIWLGSRTQSEHEFTNLVIESVPEPATLALLGLGGAVMLSGRRRCA